MMNAIKELLGARDVEDVMRIVRRTVRGIIGADGVTFVLREGDKVFYAEEDAIGSLWKGQRFPIDACISGHSILQATPIVIEDVYADARIPHDAYRPTFVTSLLMVPIGWDAPVGALGAYWSRSHRATSQEVSDLQALANAAATALLNAELLARERRALEAAEFARRELERADAYKTQFLAQITHELRTPLNGVLGFAELLLRPSEQPLTPTQRRYAENILVRGRHLLAMINDLLDLARLESGRLTLSVGMIDPRRLIDEASEIVARSAEEKGVRIRKTVAGGAALRGDGLRLRQALVKLLENAIKFGAAGAEVELGVHDLGTSTRFWVQDRGPGMPLELLSRLFRPFTQGEPDLTRLCEGTGLGLAIASRLVALHGGEMVVHSAPDGGTAIGFIVPHAPTSSTSAPHRTPAALEPSQ